MNLTKTLTSEQKARIRRINEAKAVTERIWRTSDSTPALKSYAQDEGYCPEILAGIFHRLRKDRQILIHGMLASGKRHFYLATKFWILAIFLEDKIKELCEEFYVHSGSELLLDRMSEAKFVTPQYLRHIQEARKKYLDQKDLALAA